MSRYIDADKLVAWCMEIFQAQSAVAGKAYVRALLDAVDSCPTADVVEVVRCNNCKHLTVINHKSIYARCEKTGYVFLPFATDTREHFCAYGERKENGT